MNMTIRIFKNLWTMKNYRAIMRMLDIKVSLSQEQLEQLVGSLIQSNYVDHPGLLSDRLSKVIGLTAKKTEYISDVLSGGPLRNGRMITDADTLLSFPDIDGNFISKMVICDFPLLRRSVQNCFTAAGYFCVTQEDLVTWGVLRDHSYPLHLPKDKWAPDIVASGSEGNPTNFYNCEVPVGLNSRTLVIASHATLKSMGLNDGSGNAVAIVTRDESSASALVYSELVAQSHRKIKIIMPTSSSATGFPVDPKGPVTLAIDATAFSSYHSGIMAAQYIHRQFELSSM